MTDDLVKRLRDLRYDGQVLMRAAAADRIERLEEALRDVIDSWDWWQVDTYDRCQSVPSDAIHDARKTLENNQ
jgi:hypothetical protein